MQSKLERQKRNETMYSSLQDRAELQTVKTSWTMHRDSITTLMISSMN